MTPRLMRHWAITVSALLCLAATAQAQDYPSRPIRLIVATAPGGVVDTLGRIVADELTPKLGQSVIVENRPGATNLVGSDAVSRAASDGYTLMLGTSEMTFLPYLKKSYKLDPLKDFTPVARVTSSWTIFAINPKVPAQTLPELVSYAKANPGAVRYGTPGVGGSLHLAVELLRLKTGADFVHVPYRGGAPAVADAIAGHIEMVSMGLATARAGEGGKLRLLAQAGPSRHPLFPDVPTTGELGLPDVQMETWFAVVGPPDLPPAVVDRLDRALAEVAALPSFKEKLARVGAEVSWTPHRDFPAAIAKEMKTWEGLIPQLGIPLID